MAFTFFFRDLPVLAHGVDEVLRVALGRMRIKVWDAGCALGQEPYTLAILFAEKMGAAFNNLYLDATDYDEENHFGDVVREGIYRYDDLQRIPQEIFSTYFEHRGEDRYQIVQRIRNRVFFRYHDLLTLEPIGTDYSMIVCKNVLLHFSYPQRIEVIRMFHRSLTTGGVLAMENTQKMPTELAHLFEQVHPDSQLYRKR